MNEELRRIRDLLLDDTICTKEIRLTDRERSIAHMKYVRGLKMWEIGAELSLSESTIKKSHIKLLRKISKALEK